MDNFFVETHNTVEINNTDTTVGSNIAMNSVALSNQTGQSTICTCPKCGFTFNPSTDSNVKLTITHTPLYTDFDPVPPTPESTTYPLSSGSTIDLKKFKITVNQISDGSVSLVIIDNQNVVNEDKSVDYHKDSSAIQAFNNHDYRLFLDSPSEKEEWVIKIERA